MWVLLVCQSTRALFAICIKARLFPVGLFIILCVCRCGALDMSSVSRSLSLSLPSLSLSLSVDEAQFFHQVWRSYDRASLIYSFKYNQQDATLYNILYFCQCSTCF